MRVNRLLLMEKELIRIQTIATSYEDRLSKDRDNRALKEFVDFYQSEAKRVRLVFEGMCSESASAVYDHFDHEMAVKRDRDDRQG